MTTTGHTDSTPRAELSVRTCRNPECGARYVVPKGSGRLPGCPRCHPQLPFTAADTDPCTGELRGSM